ncbi:MAG: carboxymuconolactone decarboxylase family protein [Deltaproteobacteria bacterium]|nr:MAG: carboxymuconolactone decarboxylase family protein [Deltaproteobacteria bacterium]
MSRIRTPKGHRFPWYVRLFLWNQKRRYGRVLEPARLWGRSPWVFCSLALLYGALDRKSSPLEPPLRSLVTVRVSQLNWCAFCVDINSATLMRRGCSEEKVAMLKDYRTSELFDAREKAALSYADAMTGAGCSVDDALFQRLREHFDEDAIIELTALIAFQNMSSRFNAALGVEPQGFCVKPEHSDPHGGRP